MLVLVGTKKTDGEEFDWAVWLSRPLGVAQKQEPGTDHAGPRSQYPSRNQTDTEERMDRGTRK